MVTEAALAEAFRQGQAQGAARAQAAVRVAFDRYSGREPARYLDSAVRVLALGHAQSAAAGRAYYVESRVAAGLPVDLPATEPVLFDLEAAVVSLRVNGEVAEARKVREGLGDQAAREFARAETLRYTKRAVLGGARDTVTRLALADRDALGFSRISDGRPCAFCAMLVSRGPVYTADTAGFRAHNGCGCMPRPMYRGHDDSGWTPQAREFRDLYDRVQAGDFVDADGRPRSFRSVVEERQRAAGATPLAPVARISPRSEASARTALSRRLTAGDLTSAEGLRIASAARDLAFGRITRGDYATTVAQVEYTARERLLGLAA